MFHNSGLAGVRSPLSQAAADIWHAGVAAVDGRRAITDRVRIDGDDLWIEGQRIDGASVERLIVVGGGKAAGAMAAGWNAAVGDWRPAAGWVNVPDGGVADAGPIHVHAARPAGANRPTDAAVEGTRRMLRLIAEADPRTLVVFLVSGGGSALITGPAAGVTVEEKATVADRLLGRGVPIGEVNVVRSTLSDVKGGRMLGAVAHGRAISLILSDVLGDDPASIASGPTVPPIEPLGPRSETTLRRHELWGDLSEAAKRAVKRSDADVPTVPHDLHIVGSNPVAVDEAGSAAEAAGFDHLMHVERSTNQSAEDAGRIAAEFLIRSLRGEVTHNAFVGGGEPVVRLPKPQRCGVGGRAMQTTLAAYRTLRDAKLSDAEWDRLTFLAAGTDGEDGPTEAAGAFIDADVHRHATASDLDVDEHLARCDAHTFFQRSSGLFVTGPTGTNVCDLRVALVR